LERMPWMPVAVEDAVLEDIRDLLAQLCPAEPREISHMMTDLSTTPGLWGKESRFTLCSG
jgi:hypothetical protein